MRVDGSFRPDDRVNLKAIFNRLNNKGKLFIFLTYGGVVMLSRVLRAITWSLFGTRVQKRRVRHELARISAGLFGDFPLSEDHKLWREDKEFLNDYRRLSPGNPYSQDRKFMLRELVRFTRDVTGDIAECGCYRGASAYFMATEVPSDVTIHLFDSFEGLSEVSAEDFGPIGGNAYWSSGDLATNEAAVKETLESFQNVRIYKGWIPERFPEVGDREFRLVHIDVDLYHPTLASMQFFYERVSPGGVIVIDDYGFTTCPGAFHAVTEFMREKPEYVLHMPTGQGVIVRAS